MASYSQLLLTNSNPKCPGCEQSHLATPPSVEISWQSSELYLMALPEIQKGVGMCELLCVGVGGGGGGHGGGAYNLNSLSTWNMLHMGSSSSGISLSSHVYGHV